MDREVELVHELLSELAGGKGPPREKVAEYSAFMKSVIKRFELFYSKDVPAKGGKANGTVTLYGGEALQRQYSEVKSAMEKGDLGRETMMAIKPLKQYMWMLDPSQEMMVKQWIGANADALQASAAQIEDQIDSGAIVKFGDEAASSSSRPASASAGPLSKKRALAVERLSNNRASMLKFFDGAA